MHIPGVGLRPRLVVSHNEVPWCPGISSSILNGSFDDEGSAAAASDAE